MNITDHFTTNKKFNIKKSKRKETNIHVWLLVDSHILIKNVTDNCKSFDIEDITLSTTTIDQILDEIEYKWSILCSFTDLEEVYNFEYSQDDERINVLGFALKVQLTDGQIALVQEKYNGYFIDYGELDGRFKNISKDWVCNEALSQLIDRLYLN